MAKQTKPTASKTPAKTPLTTQPADGLVGRCFVVWSNDNQWNYEGVVRARLDDEHYLVQFFDALMGQPSTMAVVSVGTMVVKDLSSSLRTAGAWEFFEDNEHLRQWVPLRRGG